MNEEVLKVKAYYDGDDEENRFLDPRKRVEYVNTCRILAPYIPVGCSVLDCAAGTGAYEEFLLERRCGRIVASDLSDHNVSLLRERYGGQSGVEIYADDALDLSRHEDGSFDRVLCLGPMYHLKPELMEQCLLECLRVLKRDGLGIFAYMPRHFAMWNLLHNPVYQVPFEDVMFLAENGRLPQPRRGFWGCAYFSSPEEMLKMAERAGCQVIDHRGVDLELGNFFDKLAGAPQEELDRLADYLYEHSADPYLLGGSKHNLIVIKKV